MSILKLAMFSVSIVLIRAVSYNASFETSYVCGSSASGTSIGYHGNVASNIVCGIMCANDLNCKSFLFSTNSTCFLKNGFVTDENSCDTNVLYGKRLSVETNNCTEPVGNVRLCNGTGNGAADATKGRVEVFIENQWGSICDDYWEDDNAGYTNARVVCKMFGFTDGVSNISAAFGQSSGPIFLDDISCLGTETSILNCNSLGIGIHNCGHVEDVGVTCF